MFHVVASQHCFSFQRMAHLGLTLSDRSAGITSPFVSSKKTVAGVVTILLEGRAALSTNISIYKHVGLSLEVQVSIHYDVLTVIII